MWVFFVRKFWGNKNLLSGKFPFFLSLLHCTARPQIHYTSPEFTQACKKTFLGNDKGLGQNEFDQENAKLTVKIATKKNIHLIKKRQKR